jgi:uncharacterized RDD family membrane protein YckC
MRRPDHSPDEPLLFDLPLGRPEDGAGESAEPERRPAPERGARREKATSPTSPTSPTSRPLPASGPRPAPEPPEPSFAVGRNVRPVPEAPQAHGDGEPAAPAAPGRRLAGAGRRLAAGGADLALHAALLVGVFFGCRALGVQPALRDWPPLLLFILTFSFIYSIIPLAFWGQTLGMTWAGLVSLNRDGEPLTFDQTARRWVGGLLTLALAGLPLLTALRGRTLSDLISGSETRAAHEPA